MKVLIIFLMSFMQSTVCLAKESQWPEMSIFHISSEWQNESSQKVKLDNLSGKVTVLAMVYTSCQHTCPMIISKLVGIQKKLPKNMQKKIQLALVSFDPERDTPEALGKYKKKRKLGEEWTLLTGTPSEIRKLAAVLGVSYKKEKNGDFSHSNIISLINQKGEVVEQIMDLGKKTDSLTKKITELVK